MSVRDKKFTVLGIMIVFFMALLVLFIPPVYLLKYNDTINVTRWRKKIGRIEESVGRNQQSWVNVNQMSLHMIHAVLVSEDARFFDHQGLDFREIWASIITNIEKKKFSRGASTITQQLVKICFLNSEKNIIRKLREMIGAIILEKIFTKEEILEWYLNVLPLGDGVYGIKEGAKAYFNSKPELLSIVQAVNLVLILPSPNRWSKNLRQERLSNFGRKRFAMILTKLLEENYITDSQWQHAMATGDFGSPVDFQIITF